GGVPRQRDRDGGDGCRQRDHAAAVSNGRAFIKCQQDRRLGARWRTGYPASRVAWGRAIPWGMLWVLALAAAARSFGGFAAEEDKYLAGNRVCEPIAVKPDGEAAGMPRCAEVDRRAQKDLGFTKPARGRETPDGKKLAVAVEDGKIKLTWLDGARERVLAA